MFLLKSWTREGGDYMLNLDIQLASTIFGSNLMLLATSRMFLDLSLSLEYKCGKAVIRGK